MSKFVGIPQGLLPKIATEQLSEYFETAQNYIDGLTQNSLVDWTKRVTIMARRST